MNTFSGPVADSMDKTWVKLHRKSTEYKVGLQNFIRNSLIVASHEGKIKCPCQLCANRSWRSPGLVYKHLQAEKMSPDYEDGLWDEHGEALPNPVFLDEIEDEIEDQPEVNLDMNDMLTDAFANNSPPGSPYIGDDGATMNTAPPEVQRFYNLINEANVDLYPGSTKMKKLEYLVRLYQIKCLGGISDKALSLLLKLTKSILPDGETLPDSFYKAKRSICDLGLSYEKIDACPNDCMIYWKDTANLDKCHTCGTSRYLYETIEDGITTRKVSAKVLRYFPVTPRLQRLFMSRCTSNHMTWHATDRPIDGRMRHPADSPAWKELDRLYPSFAQEVRNVRLGLASDGFNPFGNMSSAHSIWPVVLTVYNLPPWLCMKQPYMLLSLVIPSPKAPGNDIDVFLAPLIDELKSLWDVGAATYDVISKQSFTMRAALLWTINDFPAYANLSGWSTKGKMACPHCGDYTDCLRLYYGKKFCYMGHRRFLPISHRFRSQKRPFNGKQEHRPHPIPMTGLECLFQLSTLQFKFGKATAKPPRRRKGDAPPYNGPWKKESIFFQLPYWKDLLIRHNLDVMHIEKNICDAVLGTLLGIDGKNKDSIKARADLERLNIWPKLHPERRAGKTFCPPAIFTLSNDEKTMMCEVFASFRPPDSFSSYIADCVQVKEKKLVGLKSHDCHIILHHLLPLAIRRVLPRPLCMVLLELSSFFRHLGVNNSTSESFSQLTPRIVLVLCQLEKMFPPSFFDIMVHLPIHLAYEAAIAGPVHFRTMWPVERNLGTLKRYVRNKNRPEGSIAEGYIADEAMSFCSMYLEDSVTRRTNLGRNADAEHRDVSGGYSIFLNIGHAIGGSGKEVHMDYNEWLRVHRYVLLNCPEIKPFVDQHIEEGRRRKGRKRMWEADQESYRTFPDWFAKQVKAMQMDPATVVHPDMVALANGPVNWCIKHNNYVINGYRFRINRIDKKKKNQNSGVFVRATRNSYASRQDRNPRDGELDYYGVLNDVIELNYEEVGKIVLFECDWCNSEGNSTGLQIDEYGFVSVNFTKLISDGDTLILASQAEQD
ncbi:uncharacterized protein LOC133737546 [Rosa rugosa]|uniref:uncharacterized protein LOC133737546 n=1 Tax=Rosa rugosa TaxID=74645 RepID=UPI002B402D8C|nr:uncharacterized protein LOC133737546 [Rosa rugosa]